MVAFQNLMMENLVSMWIKVPEGSEIIDYSGYSIAPGLVDTQIHGFSG